ncbi:MAG: hypothetical protein V9E89_11735 [Ilumatobacteraceae bacterium]
MYSPTMADSDRLDRHLNQLGASLFFHTTTLATAAADGVTDIFVLYAAGRAGVMGDVGAGQAAASLGFFPESLVRELWRQAEALMPPRRIARIYATAMATTAREIWDEGAAIDVVDLGTAVAESVPLLGLPLFAGWRELPRPDDPVGAATLVVHTLRELRGEIHTQSVASNGLHPLEAEVVSRGDEGAALHQWPRPWPEPGPFEEQVAAADVATGERMRRIYGRSIGGDGVARLTAAAERLARS